jgi:hypothetical protein
VWDANVGEGENAVSKIFTWTPKDGVVQLTDGASWDFDPDVSGDRIVWWSRPPGGVADVYTWTPEDGEPSG